MSLEENMTESLTILKEALIALKPERADGFEGFVRITFSAVTGIHFRLAASGLQGGLDGDALLPGDPVCFEAKRYTGKISRNDVLTKIVDLARNNDAPDRLWVLGATKEVSAQLATAVREDGDLHAISTLILDWTVDPLPLLAVAAVAAGGSAIDFLVVNCNGKPSRDQLTKAFSSISKHPEFESLRRKLSSNLVVPVSATARAVEVNKGWRTVSFGSPNMSRERFGQALAIGPQPGFPPLRTALRDRVKTALRESLSIILRGGEGERGKENHGLERRFAMIMRG